MEIPYTVSTPRLHLSLFKGDGRVRVEHLAIVSPEPLASILSPSARGEADGTLSDQSFF
jgi:hypothetical protein